MQYFKNPPLVSATLEVKNQHSTTSWTTRLGFLGPLFLVETSRRRGAEKQVSEPKGLQAKERARTGRTSSSTGARRQFGSCPKGNPTPSASPRQGHRHRTPSWPPPAPLHPFPSCFPVTFPKEVHLTKASLRGRGSASKSPVTRSLSFRPTPRPVNKGHIPKSLESAPHPHFLFWKRG